MRRTGDDEKLSFCNPSMSQGLDFDTEICLLSQYVDASLYRRNPLSWISVTSVPFSTLLVLVGSCIIRTYTLGEFEVTNSRSGINGGIGETQTTIGTRRTT